MTVSPMARFQKQLEDLASDCRLVRVAAPLGPGGVTNRNSFALNHPGSDHAHSIQSGSAAPPDGLADLPGVTAPALPAAHSEECRAELRAAREAAAGAAQPFPMRHSQCALEHGERDMLLSPIAGLKCPLK